MMKNWILIMPFCVALLLTGCSNLEVPSVEVVTADQYNQKGIALNKQGQHEQAISEFNKAIELDPSYALAYNNRGFAYSALNKKAEAIADFEKFITLTSNPQRIEIAKQQIEELSK